MKNSIYQSELILKMNGRLFMNALDSVTEEHAKQRISDHNNPLNWLGTHTVWARYSICAMLGKPVAKNPYSGMFENFKPFDPAFKYPSLSEIKAEWNKASSLLIEALASVTEEHLAAESVLKSPTGDFTNAGTIAFLTQHESYEIGQMALLKKYFTKEAMKYS